MSECSICNENFDVNSEGGTEGVFGMLPVFFCPTCLASCLNMADEFSESAWNESERPASKHSQGIFNSPCENPDAKWIRKKCLTTAELNASND